MHLYEHVYDNVVDHSKILNMHSNMPLGCVFWFIDIKRALTKCKELNTIP